MTQLTLSKLKFTARPNIVAATPLQNKQNKLISRLQEQKEMVVCHMENKDFVAYKEVWLTDEESGLKQKVKQPKKIRAWFYQVEEDYYLEVRYGNKALEIQKGKPAIQVGKVDALLETIDALIEAVKQGELDTQLNKITGPRKSKG